MRLFILKLKKALIEQAEQGPLQNASRDIIIGICKRLVHSSVQGASCKNMNFIKVIGCKFRIQVGSVGTGNQELGTYCTNEVDLI